MLNIQVNKAKQVHNNNIEYLFQVEFSGSAEAAVT